MKPHILAFFVGIVCLFILSPANLNMFAQGVKNPGYGTTDSQILSEFPDGAPVFSPADFRYRVESISPEIKLTYNKFVKGHIEAYLRYPVSMERMLGTSTIYFPTFERYLEKYQIPNALKYLPIIESALKPQAVSRVGAGGLWQFMPYTGAEYGLNINSSVDERFDPHLASEAAARFLYDLNQRYDDWLLAIAAYNCGPGRVNKAIRQAGSKNIWKIYRYLPRETRGYVPAFIAAAYMMNYYHLHGLNPVYPSIDLQLTESTIVYNKTDFTEIVKKTDIDLETIKVLNPAFLRDHIPANGKGYILTLPAPKMALFLGPDPVNTDEIAKAALRPGEKQFITELENSAPIIYEIQSGETLWDIARQYDGVTVSDLIQKNNLTDLQKVRPGIHIIIPES